MTRQTELSQKICDYCGLSLGPSRLICHEPNGTSGVFHVEKCLEAARNVKADVSLARRLMDDAELIVGVE